MSVNRCYSEKKNGFDVEVSIEINNILSPSPIDLSARKR